MKRVVVRILESMNIIRLKERPDFADLLNTACDEPKLMLSTRAMLRSLASRPDAEVDPS